MKPTAPRKSFMDSATLQVHKDNYAIGPQVLMQALVRVPHAARQWRPAPDTWSVHEIICHCADSETYAATRLRLLLAGNDPLIVGYDQDHWSKVFAYHDLPLESAIDVTRTVRANTVSLVRSLTLASLAFTGRHTESGTYSVEDWIAMYGAHLHDHADQIASNYEQWTGAGKPAVEEG
jgi:hypothetical protein